MTRRSSWLATPFVGLLGGLIASAVGWPLPWIVGPMLAVICIRCTGWLIADIPHGRKGGQWIIATGIGLHFTEDVVQQMLGHASIILICALLTLLLSFVGVVIFRRSGNEPVTSFFASMPGGASEMINLASRYGALHLDRVAASQSMRMVLIVLCVPVLFSWGVPAVPAPERLPVDWGWLAILFPLGGLIALGWQHLHKPNPWMLGPLFVCALAAAGLDVRTELPIGVGEAGQWLMGCSLGSYFDRAFFRSAPAFLLRVVAFTLLMSLGAAGIGWGIAHFSGLSAIGVMLGMMPGGISEVSLTAMALNQSVALVTAIQVVRFVMVVFLAEPSFMLWSRLGGMSSKEGPPS
ncbi:AbrB family transcriptional regulator [Pseudomonas lopnurensis]|uniref:AbrB family transcriptional regulator n=1 Tax=Pseudomonas lopnurensis TaxID=1477517 RepID=UPI0028AF1E8D|nr:AbrB family transcriptional regulator [Pseudomonas lopnurensis]